MSASLLKRSLELFNEDDNERKGSAAKKKSKKSNYGSNNHPETKRKSVNTKKSQKPKTEYQQNQDRTEESLQFLQRLSKVNKTDAQTTKTILTQHKGRLSKNIEKLEPVDNSTVFNNRDFDKFEEEYDFFS